MSPRRRRRQKQNQCKWSKALEEKVRAVSFLEAKEKQVYCVSVVLFERRQRRTFTTIPDDRRRRRGSQVLGKLVLTGTGV